MINQIEDRIEQCAIALPILIQRLTDCGYLFARPADVLPGVEPDVEQNIQYIEQVIGAVPLSLALFWRTVGSVNLCGGHPAWKGCGYPDPLVVFPSSMAIAELREFLGDREERMRCNVPYEIPVAPDKFHKANVSGARCYVIDCPATSDDPLLKNEPHHLSFLSYLEFALQHDGFPGLSASPQHTWTI